MIKCTFDTNQFDKVVRPHIYANDPNHADFLKVHRALQDGRVVGFLCETVVTLEGIKVADRASVFGSTTLTHAIAVEDPDRININLKMEQPLRTAVHPKQSERLVAALDLGIKLLGAPRIGMPRVELLPNANPYVAESHDQLCARLDRYHALAQAIEARGLGSVPAQQLAQRLGNSTNVPSAHWFTSLGAARDIHEKREVARAIAEWADGDSIAAHFGYGNDFFCTSDEAGSGHPSILDAAHRAWLTADFDLRFCTARQLAALL